MLLVPREDGERGASVVAALAFVLFFTAFGFVTAVLVADSTVANARSQMLAAAGTNRLAALDPKATGGGSSAVSPVSTDTDGKVGTTKVESKCNAGEVHTVRTVTDAKNVDGKVVTTSSPRDFKAVCLLPDARGAMMPGPQASDPTCKFRSQTQCVVRYCPPVAEGQEEACQIISCKEGASECMKKAMETALTKPPPTAIADLQNQGAAFQTFDGTTVSTQDAVDPNLYKAVEDQQAVYNKQSEISAIDSQITETNKYFDTYKSVCADTGMVGGTTENSYCSTATWEENNKKLLDLNAQKEQAQSQLDQQVADLKNRTTSMYPGTGEWTGVGSGQDVTGGVNGPGYTDYVKQSSADQIVSKCAGSCQTLRKTHPYCSYSRHS